MPISATIPCPPSGSPSSSSVLVFFDGAIRRHALRVGEHRIGRQSNCDVIINDPQVSREHALILADLHTLRVRDLGSQNGTRLNGRKISNQDFTVIEAGSTLELGSTSIFVRSDSSNPAPQPEVCQREDWPDNLTLVHRSPQLPREIVTRDGRMVSLLEAADRAAKSNLSILVTGETGVGKELLATRIHHASPRRNGPFVVVNCAAIPPALLESELFGHERGSFTGADRSKVGLVRAASGGSLLFDEIGELPLMMQAKLLRSVESGEVLAVGASRPTRIDVRFVAATNRDLRQAVAQGVFREDLYHRLAGVSLRIPPLRERPMDIVPLVMMFAKNFAALSSPAAPAVEFSQAALDRLRTHHWSGNARELKNIVEGAILLSRGGVIHADELPLSEAMPLSIPQSSTVTFVEQAETGNSAPPTRDRREEVVRALTNSGGNQAKAAMLLGISRRTLVNWLDAYDLPRPRKMPRTGSAAKGGGSDSDDKENGTE